MISSLPARRPFDPAFAVRPFEMSGTWKHRWWYGVGAVLLTALGIAAWKYRDALVWPGGRW
jgi:hypothetical protein